MERIHSVVVRLCALAVMVATGAEGAVIRVPEDATLEAAVQMAQEGDEVVISPAGSPYVLSSRLSVVSRAITLRGATGDPADVVIDGAGMIRAIDIISVSDPGTRLEGLTIRNGQGIAVYVEAVGVVVRNCVFRDTAVPIGAGSGLNIRARVGGGRGDVIIEGCVFERNGPSVHGAGGRGLEISGRHVTITDTVFRDNGPPAGSPLNQASSGGGLLIEEAQTVSLARCRFERNRGWNGGAVALTSTGTSLTVHGCQFVDNGADRGGALFASRQENGEVRVTSSLFLGNVALHGGAVFTERTTTLTNVTMVDNTALQTFIVGGEASVGSLTIDNSILWSNTYLSLAGLFPPGATALVRRSVLQHEYTGAPGSGFNITADPRFVNHGARDFRLRPTSPGVDAGDTWRYIAPMSDAGDMVRLADVPGAPDTGVALGGAVIDLGAFETQPDGEPACPGDANGDGRIDFLDLNALLSTYGTICR